MDRDELIFKEYKLYAEQKDRFIDRNFTTNRFYMVAFVVIIIAMIYTSSVVFMNKVSAPLLFSLIGIGVCTLWWMNVDTYNTLIKIKFGNVLETIEDKLPVKPFQDEYKSLEEIKSKKVFLFSDIQKLVAILGAIFFFAVFISEITPIVLELFNKIIGIKGGI